ncbi:RNA/RNP complex-1-interacting phosphatase isoform X2 [Pleurodeles waltl]|uniref:RNA/RNP complex-1-interacting phosphatase isoform X2 n=1 Tax=Pleurodeles waltl TaxID=8319 RepID=UPI00370978B0
MGKMNKLPERWVDYIPIGIRMSGTRFIAFKVPLSGVFDSKLSPKQRFSPVDLVRKVKEQSEELGMIIDLTCTTRYYNPVALPKTMAYSKIYTAGHAIPDAQTIQQFKSIVTQFLSENTGNDKLIGVHCTHGLNRTGYLVCRYLIDLEGMDPNAAIELFNKSRGHSIERQNYILDLQGKPASDDPTQKIARSSVHSEQECVANGNLSSRSSHFQYHNYQAPWSSSWQQRGPPSFRSVPSLQRPAQWSDAFEKVTRPVMQRGQVCTTNSSCSKRSDHGHYHQFPTPWEPSRHSRYDRQNGHDYVPYPRQHRPWHDESWKRPHKWEQAAPTPQHTRLPRHMDYEEPRLPLPPALPSPVKQPREAAAQRPHDSGRKNMTYKHQKHRDT